jgi:two-component sensor histidine kinase
LRLTSPPETWQAFERRLLALPCQHHLPTRENRDTIWIERDRPVASAPTRQGFGTRLIRPTVPRELECSITAGYAATGVRCIIDFHLRRARLE